MSKERGGKEGAEIFCRQDFGGVGIGRCGESGKRGDGKTADKSRGLIEQEAIFGEAHGERGIGFHTRFGRALLAEAAGEVGGKHPRGFGASEFVNSADGGGDGISRSTRGSDAEKTVEQHQRGIRCLRDVGGNFREHRRCERGEFGVGVGFFEDNPPTGASEVACGHEDISAVVAFSEKDAACAGAGVELLDEIGHRPTGVLHEMFGGLACREGGLLGGGHLGGGEDHGRIRRRRILRGRRSFC